MLKLLRSRKGLTLIELVVTLAIIGILLSIVFSVHTAGSKFTSKGSTQSDVQNDVRLVAQTISAHIRTANFIELLSAMPATPDIQKKYFYVQGNTIKHFNLGADNELLHETSASFVPVLEFKKNASNGKVLNFTIQCTYKGQSYHIESEVLAQNFDAASNIQGSSGAVVAYSCPLTNAETVMLDKTRLNIMDTNLFLNPESNGSYTLGPPPSAPNILSLPSLGFNSSVITWTSNNPLVIKNDGTVLRPGVDAGEETVVLTAKLTKGTPPSETVAYKEFTINVCDLDPLVLGNTTPASVSLSSAYEHIFTATGGDTAYSFSTGEPLYGLTLEANGRLTGNLNAGATDFSFNLIVKDGYSPVPNQASEWITIVVVP